MTSCADSTVQAIRRMPKWNTWVSVKCNRRTHVGRSHASTNPTWRLTSAWNWDGQRGKSRLQTCQSRRPLRCPYITSFKTACDLRNQQTCSRDRPGMTGYVWDVYETSLPVSTYLVGMMVSEFTFIDSPPGLSTTPFRIWARPDAIGQAELTLLISKICKW